MNIALIVTLGGDLVRSTEHVGIGYLSAYLRKHGHKVKVLEIKEPDIQNEGRYIPALADCEFVGFTTTCVTMKNVACLVDVVKSNFPNSYIACGGHMATFSGKELLEKYPHIDFAIQGEGEITFLELVEALDAKKNLSDVLGIVYRFGNKVVENKSRPLIDNLDMLPFQTEISLSNITANFNMSGSRPAAVAWGIADFAVLLPVDIKRDLAGEAVPQKMWLTKLKCWLKNMTFIHTILLIQPLKTQVTKEKYESKRLQGKL